MSHSKDKFALCIFLLIIAGMIWGMGFVASKWTLMAYGPFWSNGLRYLIAAVVSLPLFVFFKSWERNLKFWQQGLIAASFLFIAVAFQVIGLKYTSVAKSSFLTSLYAFFVPLILLATGKKKLSLSYWLLLGVCLIGIALLCNLKMTDFNLGDFYTLLCALFLSFHILYLERIAYSIKNGFEFNCMQCLLIGIFSPVVAYYFEGGISLNPLIANPLIPGPLAGFIILAVFSSVFAFGVQVYVQKILPSHIVAPLFLLESPFGAFFGFLFLKEGLNFTNIVGLLLILLSVASIPLNQKWKK